MLLSCINKLKTENESLKKDIESKENSICNLLDANKELSLSNNYLESRIITLEKVIKQHEENECRLNKERISYKKSYDQEYEYFDMAYNLAIKNRDKRIKLEKELSRVKGELDKLRNYCRMTTGIDILKGEI